jgi:uncharacterized membrane protein YbhN (UPF0104 family)
VQVRSLLRATDTAVLALLLAGTAANLVLGGFYDVAALGGRKLPPSATRRWSVGVIAFAWSNFLTVGPLAGPALRLWLYAPMGVSIPRARRALVTILASFTIGLFTWCAAVLVPVPSVLAGPPDGAPSRSASGPRSPTRPHASTDSGARRTRRPGGRRRYFSPPSA